MSKSLNARCIRRWEVEFKGWCDSKVSPWWRNITFARSSVELRLLLLTAWWTVWPTTTRCMIFSLQMEMTLAGLLSFLSGTAAGVENSTGKRL